MSQKFVKGRTNNHLTWVMVDATDFATPESALSAAMKIKVYGKLRGATGVNFVTSGTGSLTNDIQHVGASVLGIYTIALAKADLSDASAAWYDQYVVSLSATGAAYQTLVVDGGIDDSTMLSRATQINSRALVIESQASDAYSAIIAPLASMTSDVASAVWAHTIGARVDSRVLVNKSAISDAYSMLSDFLSDFQSRVPKAVATNSQLSDLASDLKSYLVVMSGVQSDVYSLLSDHHSDFQSRVPKRVATDSQLSDMASDLKSAIAAVTVTIDASAASDIASAVWAHAVGTRVDSRVLVNKSVLSDVYSLLSDVQSDFQSRVPKRVATDSQLSDLASDLKSYLAVMSGVQSDVYSLLSDHHSDFQSRVPKRVATDSQLSDLHSDLRSLAIVNQSAASDIYSLLSDVQSDFQSRVPKRVATDSQLSDLASDLKSAIGAVTFTISASDLSDIASAVVANLPSISASDISDIASAVWANAVGARVDSRVLVNKSAISDIYSLLSDVQSDFQSRVPKRVATDSQLSALMSDVMSDITALPAAVLDLADGVETGLTLREAQRLQVAASAGKLSGAATTTVKIRNTGDTKDRITATVDADGNRTAITTDLT